MESRPLGDTSTRVPLIGLGTARYTGGPGPLRAGIARGAAFIDTAEAYGSEEVVGAAVEGLRHETFIATKVWPTHLRPDAVKRAAHASLKRLRTDYIDLYQIHWPNRAVPLEETLGAMEDLVDAGIVRYLGVSNFGRDELQAALSVGGRHPIVSNQVSFSLTDRRACADLLPYCQEHNITLVAYSPLGRGLDRMAARDSHGVLETIAKTSGRTPAQIALNWCIQHSGVVAIPKANSLARIEENCGATGWRLSDEQYLALEGSVRESGSPFGRPNLFAATLRDAAKRLLGRD